MFDILMFSFENMLISERFQKIAIYRKLLHKYSPDIFYKKFCKQIYRLQFVKLFLKTDEINIIYKINHLV